MKIKIDIKSIFGDVLFSFEKDDNTIKDTLVEAYLILPNLRGADLRCADLRGAYLRGADLRGANLSDANLKGVDLSDADLSDADFVGSNLRYADLRGADLRCADLSEADLRGADLKEANLREANLRGADLKEANLKGADLSDIYYSVYTYFLASQCPTEGSFIGWKRVDKYIIKLKICEDANRSSSTSIICRCSKAEVLEIQNIDGSIADITEICSSHDKTFIYKVGETVEVKDFDKCRWNKFSNGIYFFIDRDMAVAYKK